MQIQFAVINVSCCGVVQPRACRKNEALGFCVCVFFLNICIAMPGVTEMEDGPISLCQIQQTRIGVHPKSVNLNFIS